MAILTTGGRAALAAAIKQQALHLALGEGDPVWDTLKEISASFDADGLITVGLTHLADIRVTIGHSDLGPSVGSGGSNTTSSVTPAG